MFCADARLMTLGLGPLGSGALVPVAVAGSFSGGLGCFVVFWGGVGWSRAGKEPSEGWEDDGLTSAG